MTQWKTPQVVIDKFVPNQYVAACAQLAKNIRADDTIYLDYFSPSGYYNDGEGGSTSPQSTGIIYLNPNYRPVAGQSFSNINVYHDATLSFVLWSYTDKEPGSYNIYVTQSGRYKIAYLYTGGFLPPYAPTLDHNFDS